MPTNEAITYVSKSPAATRAAARALANCLSAGDLIGLIGHLGAGKTLFVQGLAAGLGLPPDVWVTSPTFTIINEYRGGRLSIYHADLYRIEKELDLQEIGLDEICGRGDGVVCVEWSDRYDTLGRDYLEIRLHAVDDETRELSAMGTGTRSRAVCAAWSQALAELKNPQ